MHAAIWLLAATRFTSQPRGKACDQLGGDHLVPRPAARFLAAQYKFPDNYKKAPRARLALISARAIVC